MGAISGIARWGGVAGLVYVVLVVVGHVVANVPGEAGASGDELLDFYNDSTNQRRVWAGTILIGLAAPAFIVYLAGVCARLAAGATWPMTARIAFASGTAFLVVDELGAAIAGAIAAAFVYSSELSSIGDADLARVVLILGNHWLSGLASVLAVPLVFATSLEARRRRLMPTWLAWAGLVLGALLLLSQVAFLGIPILAWILATAVWLLRSPQPPVAAG
jgi:hypothetical protein